MATPTIPDEKVLGFSAVQNRGSCFSRRDCGGAFSYYEAVTVTTEDGTSLVVDPAVLSSPADPAAWISMLILGGKSLSDALLYKLPADQTVNAVSPEGIPLLGAADLDRARAGLKADYCRLAKRHADFRGALALRGYDRPKSPDTSCIAG
ncbi:MAG: hypothetical protein AAGJ32_06660 [Pseudomonadota bacterium]